MGRGESSRAQLQYSNSSRQNIPQYMLPNVLGHQDDHLFNVLPFLSNQRTTTISPDNSSPNFDHVNISRTSNYPTNEQSGATGSRPESSGTGNIFGAEDFDDFVNRHGLNNTMQF